LGGANGEYHGDSGGREDEFKVDSEFWDQCGDGATDEQKKNAVMMLAQTIVHETAHWKDDNKKFPKDAEGNESAAHDTAGEEGRQLEKDLFGGNVDQAADGTITLDGNPVDDATCDGWLNPDNWPEPQSRRPGTGRILAAPQPRPLRQGPSALDLAISLPGDTFDLGEEIPVQVTYKNVSNLPVLVMNRVMLEGWPLYFDAVKQETGLRASFLGPEVHLNLRQADFTTLEPGATFALTVNLLRDPAAGAPLYQLLRSGTYELIAVYESLWGVEEAVSNTLTMTLGAGGSVSRTVTDAATGNPLPGAVLRVSQNNEALDTATTDADGRYTFPELPGGSYSIDATAPGHLRSTREDILVVPGQRTTLVFSLSELLARGEMRIVLSWGEDPGDLDSHLWLPEELPYHLYFSRTGGLEQCPFASLDVDDTSSFGPETVTITERLQTGEYAYAVYNYSGFPDLTVSEAQVQVFDSTGLIADFGVPQDGQGRWWTVLEVDASTGGITEINTLSDDPAPYFDTGEGCTRASP
jgi:hypothetical protein